MTLFFNLIWVYAGDGRGREAEQKATVFRRAVERKYILKSQLGRAFMNHVENSEAFINLTMNID